MSVVRTLISSNAASVAAGTTIVQPSRYRDEQGLFQVQLPATFAGTVTLYGRLNAEAPWHAITDQQLGDMVSNNTNTVVVDIFPEMTAELSGNSSAVQVEAWLMD